MCVPLKKFLFTFCTSRLHAAAAVTLKRRLVDYIADQYLNNAAFRVLT